MSSVVLAVLAATSASRFHLTEVRAFAPLPLATMPLCITPKNHAPSTATALLMGKRRKPSMKERRRQRAKKQPGLKFDRGPLEDLPPVDAWEKTRPTATAVSPTAPSDGLDAEGETAGESEDTVAKASTLVQSQRRSVDCLTFVRGRVEEAFPVVDAARSLAADGYFMIDGFLSSGDGDGGAFGETLLEEMIAEGSRMLSDDKLERDISRLGDGEYAARIVGGEAYADCPRLTEFVVSLTRHLPPLLNAEADSLRAGGGKGAVPRLDSTASMGTLRLYDRKSRLGAETLLANPEGEDQGDGDRPFGVVCGDDEGTEDDARRVTAMLFLSSKDWDASVCGGGVTLERSGEMLDAVRDRLVLIRSDACSHRQEPWRGDDRAGLGQASCVIVHLVKESQSAAS